MDKFKKFWMVVGEGPPLRRYLTKQDAEAEAERLARAYPGASFIVMEAMSKVTHETIRWREASDGDEVPY